MPPIHASLWQAEKLDSTANTNVSSTNEADGDYCGSDDTFEELGRGGFTPVAGAPLPPPMQLPQFSLKELRSAVPKHCFQRSLATSLSYLARDLFMVSALFYVAYRFNNCSPSTLSQAIFWPAYWLIQGTYLGAVWVIGHECGHQAFSEYAPVNDLVGMVVHSALLVPYFTWKITHRQHHAKVNSMEHDTVFVPMTRTEYTTWREALEDNLEDAPLYTLYHGLTLMKDTSQQALAKVDNLFNPPNVRFRDKERGLVVLSNVGVGVALANLGVLTWTLSAATMAKLFFVPYVVLNTYIISIAMLQHTDTFIPRFRSDSWKWLHASLCTVDRQLGAFLDELLHHAVDTHVCHHIFSKIPHYHAVEATQALVPLLGRYYLKDSTPIAQAFWRSYTHCKYVEDDGSVVFIKKAL